MSQDLLPMMNLFPGPFSDVQRAVEARIPSHWPQEWQAESAETLATPLLRGLNTVLQIKQEEVTDAPDATQETFLRDVTDIAADGSLRGHPLVEADFPAERAWNDYTYRRQALLGIYACNPELAIEIAKRRVVGMHGSVSGTLAPVLKGGLQPLELLRQERSFVVAGERGSHVSANVKGAVSFMQLHENAARQIRTYLDVSKGPITDERLLREIEDIAARIRKDSSESQENGWNYWWRKADRSTLMEKMRLRAYLLAPPTSKEDALQKDMIRQNFPVVYMIDDSEIKAKPETDIAGFREANDRVVRVSSSVKKEFAVKGGVTRNSLQVVLVPRAQVGMVRSMAATASLDALVSPIEDVPCIGVK